MDEANVAVQQTTREKRVPVTRENIKYEIMGAVTSVNGQTGDVVLNAEDVGALPNTTIIPTKTSDLNNDSDFQTGQQVSNAIGLETTAREQADGGLQSQIDALSASSDVTDIVGTYAALQAYDTSTLGNNDIIKVLQDEQHSDETTYYRWSTTTQTFTLIGEEGPYYTKSAADNKFQDKLTAGSNIQISGSVISATDTTYSDFTGTDGQTAGTAGLVPAPATTDADKFLKSDGTWDTVAAGPTVVQTTGTSTADVMSQDATTKMVWPVVADANVVSIGGTTNAAGQSYQHSQVAIKGTATGQYSTALSGSATGNGSVALGQNTNGQAAATASNTIAIGGYANSNADAAIVIGAGARAQGYSRGVVLGVNSRNGRNNEVSIGSGSGSDATRYLANVTDPALPQDAATKNYVDTQVGNIETILQTLNSGTGASS